MSQADKFEMAKLNTAVMHIDTQEAIVHRGDIEKINSGAVIEKEVAGNWRKILARANK